MLEDNCDGLSTPLATNIALILAAASAAASTPVLHFSIEFVTADETVDDSSDRVVRKGDDGLGLSHLLAFNLHNIHS